MNKFCNNPWQWVVQALNSDENSGLKDIEIEDRRRLYGDNKIHLPGGKGVFSYIVKELLKIYILLYVIVSAFLILSKNVYYGAYLGVITVVTICIKTIGAYKREKRVSLLQNINYATVRVFRDGMESIVKAEELVIGDIVYYSKNSLIPADLRIISAKNINVDEKNLTGEEFYKEKINTKIHGTINSLGDMKNILFKGSVIKEGEGTGIVVATGDNTQLGKLLTVLNYGNTKKNVLVPTMEKRFGLKLSIMSILAVAMYFIFYSVGNAKENLVTVLIGVYSLPIILMLFINILIVKKEMKNDLEIINSSVLQLIGEIEIIFMDKIGSFSKEEMLVKSLYTNFERYKDEDVNYNKDINIKRLVDVLLLCNNSFYNVNDNTGKGTLEEIAFIRFGSVKGAYKSIVDNRNKKIFEIPMDSDKRVVTTLTKGRRGCRANLRGNVDEILDRCTYIMVNGLEKEITNEDKERIRAMDYNLSIEGLTTQGIAYRSFGYEPSPSENIESNLVFVGIVSIETPPVEDFNEKLEFLRENDITPILFTDANKITATTFGMKTGLIRKQEEVISGVELESLSKDELIAVLGKVKIFSRIGIESKAKIVALFAKDNYRILTTGEGIGDLPSLSLSTVGVTKGEVPEVVKKLSDVYIPNDCLNVVFKLIEKGKSFTKNMVGVINLFSMVAFTEILIIFLYPIYVKAQGITSLGIVLINTVLILPLFYLVFEGVFEKVSSREAIITPILWSGTTLFTAIMAIDNASFYAYIVLGTCIIIWSLINGRVISIKSKIKSGVFIISVLVWISTIFIINTIGGIAITPIQFVSVVMTIGIYTLIEWIIKKWIVL